MSQFKIRTRENEFTSTTLKNLTYKYFLSCQRQAWGTPPSEILQESLGGRTSTVNTSLFYPLKSVILSHLPFCSCIKQISDISSSSALLWAGMFRSKEFSSLLRRWRHVSCCRGAKFKLLLQTKEHAAWHSKSFFAVLGAILGDRSP